MPFTQEYKKLMLIGRGSFAAVYKVRHKKLGYVRAIKISNEMIDSEKDHAYQSFLKECRLLLQIGNGCHPNIVHIYQPRLINSHALVEMDYVDGVTLNNYVKEKRFIDMHEFWRFAVGIVGAVGYCHADLYKFLMDPDDDNLESDPDDGSKFLITPQKETELRQKYCVNHNDLHSNNIMRRNYDGSFILLDFGLAIQNRGCVKSSSRGDGAYEYSSPEKLDGKEITAASDVYSLGILLYEVLAGEVPFVMGTDGSLAEANRIYQQHISEIPAPIEPKRRRAYEAAHPGMKYEKDYPDELEDIVMRCLEKKPANRYADAKQLLLDIQRVHDKTEASSPDLVRRLEVLERENARLTAENMKLRQEADSGNFSGFRVGDKAFGGTVAAVDDAAGLHGLIITASRPNETGCLCHVDAEDFNRLNFSSKQWYSENCFIIPAGSHLPDYNEMLRISENADRLNLPFAVWIDSADGPLAFSPALGNEIESAGRKFGYISVMKF